MASPADGHRQLQTQGGFDIAEAAPEGCGEQAVGGPDWIVIPGAHGQDFEIGRQEPTTWRRLTEDIRGLSVPTATAMLSALWPDYHVIIDRNDRDAAIGLDAAALLVSQGLDSGWIEGGKSSRWALYEWLRDVVAETAGSLTEPGTQVLPVDVERTLFLLGRRTAKTLKSQGSNWTWSEYHTALIEQLGHS